MRALCLWMLGALNLASASLFKPSLACTLGIDLIVRFVAVMDAADLFLREQERVRLIEA